MSDQGPVVQRALLTGELTRLRKAKALTQGQVAGTLEWSQAKLMRIEGGKQSISRSDMLALLREYGVDDDATQRLLVLSREANRTAWWDRYRDTGVGNDYLRIVGYEAGAAEILQSQSRVLPGLLQTRDYAEVVTSDAVRTRGPQSQVVSIVELRMERQQRMHQREKLPRQTYVLDEAVIRRHIGIKSDPDIMPEQLEHLTEVAESGQAEIRIIPFSEGSHEGLFGPFQLMIFDGPLPDIMYRERPGGQVIAESGDLAEDYKDRFAELLDKALTNADSIELMRQTTAHMREREA